MELTMEQNFTDAETKESTLTSETVKQEFLYQLEENMNQSSDQAQQVSTENPGASTRTKRSIISPPARLNKDGTSLYRRDARGILRRVYN
ncbi:hypothetical protein TSAR_010777 [Trichomalopsis sarcophagae]|uniref:Uncharacterized protein n=1 Tax=Trichomalopsis sarcophagae TaxID=543379 RepID=A0A232EJC5_9HYME|nr:hypothetical protein TSAR_010777 [Trichomalopsis sarcophagae]